MAISKIEEIIEDFRQGKMVILMDDEDRENEGDIIIALRNYDEEKQINSTVIAQNEKIAQGIIIPFYTVDDDNATGVRTGGFGSTGK